MKFRYIWVLLFIFFSCSVKKGTYAELERKSNNKTWIVAHRAETGEDLYPENSIKAIQSCIELGINIVEIDVRETKDGQLVVMHDKTVNRTTNGKGTVADFTLNQIKALNLTHKGKVTDYKVPTLEEVFQVVKKKVIVDLDIKLDTIASYQKIADLIKKYQIADQMIVFLYDKEDIPATKKMFTGANIMPRAHSVEEVMAIQQQYPFIKIIHIDEDSYDATLMKNLINKKMRIWMNALGDHDRMQKAGKNGFSKLFENYPNINVVQTDLGVQFVQFLKQK